MDEICIDADAVARACASQLEQRIAKLQSAGAAVRIALTGGTIANRTYEMLDADVTEWSAVDFFWGDERFVDAGSDDRNEKQARQAFITRLGIPEARVHPMPARDAGLSAEQAAASYAATIPDEFDIVLLGLGPDGHIASLFPGFDQVQESTLHCVPVHGSPKPPPDRLSLTIPALNRTAETWFIVSGHDKAGAVRASRTPEGDVSHTPARAARGRKITRWFMDEAAAAQL